MVVALKSTDWGSVLGSIVGDVPDDDGLITGGGEEEVWVALGGSNGSNPATVGKELSTLDHRVGHFTEK